MKFDQDEWPTESEFWIDIEEHCEDGNWSGYAISKGNDFRPVEAIEGVLKSKYDVLKAENRKLRELLIDFRDNGLRFDLNPCQPMGDWAVVTSFYLQYIKRMDESIRERAKELVPSNESAS